MINTSQKISWHASQWEQVSQMLNQDRFAHALLLEGMRGVGKRVFAHQLAQLLLCKSDSKIGFCEKCSSCEWFRAGSHPDFIVLQPEEGKKLISVNAIRSCSQQVFKTSHQNGYRVLLIDPADSMTLEAANSLLKTLEEPPPQTLLMLLTDKPARLLPTIRSRARRLQFRLPAVEDALQWLTAQNLSKHEALGVLGLGSGAPMRLDLERSELDVIINQSALWWKEWQSLFGNTPDPVKTAKIWGQSEPALFLPWMENLIRNLLVMRVSPNRKNLQGKNNSNEVLFPGIEKFKDRFSQVRLFQLRDSIVELTQRQDGSLNWGLQLEALACDCQGLG